MFEISITVEIDRNACLVEATQEHLFEKRMQIEETSLRIEDLHKMNADDQSKIDKIITESTENFTVESRGKYRFWQKNRKHPSLDGRFNNDYSVLLKSRCPPVFS